jgi:hypothetical protein
LVELHRKSSQIGGDLFFGNFRWKMLHECIDSSMHGDIDASITTYLVHRAGPHTVPGRVTPERAQTRLALAVCTWCTTMVRQATSRGWPNLENDPMERIAELP